MNKIPIMIFLLVIILGGIVYISLRLEVAEKVKEVFGINQTETKYDNAAISDDNHSSESSGYTDKEADAGGEEGIETTGDYEPSCTMRQISYSLKKFQRNSICNNYEGSTCIDKTVNCSLQLTNLDFDESGIFAIRFDFFEIENPIELDSTIVSESVGPRTERIFETVVNFQGENAAKELTCNFNTGQIPEKQVCF